MKLSKLRSDNLWVGLFCFAALFAGLATMVLGPIEAGEHYKALPALFAVLIGMIMIWATADE